MLIAFCGHKYSGKDTAAGALQGFLNVKFAGALKEMLGSYYYYIGADAKSVEDRLEGGLKEVPDAFLMGATPRHAMQTLGTEWGRQLINPNLWIEAFKMRVKYARDELNHKIMVTDLRFLNEADAVHQLGGTIIRIRRAGCHGDGHASEQEIDLIDADHTVYNNDTVEHLQQTIRSIVEHEYV